MNSRKAWATVNIAASQLWIYVGQAHLPADGSTARHARATRSVELDSPLQVRETGALFKGLVPPRSTKTIVSADMVVGWVDHGRRKTYLDSSRGLIAMTIFGEAGRKDADKKTACSCGGESLGRKRQLMKNQASFQSYLLSSRVVCQCMVSRSKVCFFLHDQDSPVTKRRMASTAMRLQIDTHQPQKVGRMPWHRRQGSGFGPAEWADQAQSRTTFGEMLSLTPVRLLSTRRPDSWRL